MSQKPVEHQQNSSGRWLAILAITVFGVALLASPVFILISIPAFPQRAPTAANTAALPVINLPSEELLREARRILKVAPGASDDHRRLQTAFIAALKELTAGPDEPDADLLQVVTDLFVSLPRSIRSVMGDVAFKNSTAALREELLKLLLKWIPRKLLTAQQLLLVSQAADEVERLSLISPLANNDVLPGSGQVSAAQLLPLAESCLTQLRQNLANARVAARGLSPDSELTMMQDVTCRLIAIPDLPAADRQRVSETMQMLAEQVRQIKSQPEPSPRRSRTSIRRRRR